MIGAKRRKRIGAALLAAVLVLSQLGATAYAEGNPADTGLCEHHSEHTAACGYVEAVKGHACEHEHGLECYTDELICGMDEDAEQDATSDAGHTHVQECYGLDCQHEHDGDCGYIEAVKGQPCGYVCKVCTGEPDKDSGTENPAVSGNDLTPPEKTGPETVSPEGAETITVTAFDELAEAVRFQTVPAGTGLTDLTLPATLGASGYTADDAPETITITGVTWEPDSPWDETAEQGSYIFTPVFPAGYALADGVELPEIAVRVGGAITLDLQGGVLTVTFDDNGTGGTNDSDNDMKPAIDDALNRISKAAVATIKLTGNAMEITGRNWKYLIDQYNGAGGWDSLTALDLSGMENLTAIQNDTSSVSFSLPKLKTLVLPDGLTQIGDFAFFGCNNLTLQQLPDGLTQIGNSAFYGCKRLDLQQLPNKLTHIEKFAFQECTGLTLTVLPDSLEQIGDHAFYGCTGLTLTSLPDRLEQIEDYSFYKCTRLALQELPSGVTEIGWHAFEGCTSLTNIIMEPTTAPTLGDDAFANTSSGLIFRVPKGGTGYNNGGWESLNTTEYIPVTSISLPPTLTLNHVQSDSLTVTFTPDDASYKNIIWESSAPGIVTVDDTGKVTAVSIGTARITAASRQGRKTAICTVTVITPITSVTLDKSAYTLYTNRDPRSFQLAATVEPADASDKTVRWVSSAPGVATVDGNGNVTAVSKGTATITVTTNDGKKMASCAVTVETEPSTTTPVTGVTLDVPPTLYTNKDPRTYKLTATVEPADASDKTVRWASSAPGVATVDGNGNVTAVSKGTATITVTTNDGKKTAFCAVTVETDSGGDGTSGGISSSGGGTSRNYIITTPEPPKPNNPVLAVIVLPMSVTEGKPATGKPDDGRTSAALAEAGRDAKAKTNGIAVQYDAKTSLNYDGFSIVIQRVTLDRLIDAKVKWLTVNTSIVDMAFDLAALQEIQKQATGDITLTAARETGLAGDALAAVGSRPAYRLSVGYIGADGKAATVTSFGAGRATVGLAYQPAATEQTGGLYLVFSADGKGAEWLYQSSYDKNSGNAIGSVGHFSVYCVGYRPAPVFTDTVNHWAKADIDFVASRGLFSGTSETTFSPDSTITRGMFVTVLGRLAGIDPAAYPSSRFTDVPDSAIYAPFVEWAASKGIVNGTGESSFSPDAAITREQMALIMRQYADKLGYALPVAREAVTFTDENQITGSMKEAVQRVQQAGIMSGKGNNRFGPKDTATRTEAAVVLRRFVEVVIDRDTAGGWGQNDAGRWLYYLDGKPVTGWKQIGGKWYYFDPDGAMAADIKIDGYEIGPDGARKE